MKVAVTSEPVDWNAMVGAETDGATLPYRFRLTVQLGEVEVVYVADPPENEGDAVFDVVDDPVDAPLRDATSWFWA